MIDEDFLRRPAPKAPYRPTDVVAAIPLNAVQATLHLLRRFQRVEAGVFWYGPKDGAGAVAAAVMSPQQRMQRGNYEVTASAMSDMVASISDHGWKPIAQVHSHPGRWVEHSRYDDLMVSSRRALSVVIPSYGHWSGRWPVGIGVHEYQDGYWHLLPDGLAAQRIRIVPAGPIHVADFR